MLSLCSCLRNWWICFDMFEIHNKREEQKVEMRMIKFTLFEVAHFYTMLECMFHEVEIYAPEGNTWYIKS